jgi:hypothetical protein
MPDSTDITLCSGAHCPLRGRCYRFRLEAHGRQDMFATPPLDPVAGTCVALWDLDTLRPSDADIAQRAYHLWQRSGCVEGREEANWHQARQELEDELTARLRPEPE